MTVTKNSIARLRWQCRRGMLELDLLLLPFLEDTFATLTSQDQQTFSQLLEENDQDLYAWLVQGVHPPHQSYLPLVKAILDHANPTF